MLTTKEHTSMYRAACAVYDRAEAAFDAHNLALKNSPADAPFAAINAAEFSKACDQEEKAFARLEYIDGLESGDEPARPMRRTPWKAPAHWPSIRNELR